MADHGEVVVLSVAAVVAVAVVAAVAAVPSAEDPSAAAKVPLFSFPSRDSIP